MKCVINTRMLLLQAQTHEYYWHLFDGYLQAPSRDGPMSVARQPPAGADIAEKAAGDSGRVDLLPGTPDRVTHQGMSLNTSAAPDIYVAAQPSELILLSVGQADHCCVDAPPGCVQSGNHFARSGMGGPPARPPLRGVCCRLEWLWHGDRAGVDPVRPGDCIASGRWGQLAGSIRTQSNQLGPFAGWRNDRLEKRPGFIVSPAWFAGAKLLLHVHITLPPFKQWSLTLPPRKHKLPRMP